MQQLVKTITEVAERDVEPQKPTLYPELQDAAEKWATHSLRTYTGDALSKALAISQALVEFVEEITPEVN